MPTSVQTLHFLTRKHVILLASSHPHMEAKFKPSQLLSPKPSPSPLVLLLLLLLQLLLQLQSQSPLQLLLQLLFQSP